MKIAKFISDRDLSEAEMIIKYTVGECSIGAGSEVENYLRIRHRYYHNLATWVQVIEAYNKTTLNLQ